MLAVGYLQINEEIQTTIKDKIDQQYGVNADVTISIDKLQREVGTSCSKG